jgi:hypothetical protein
MLTSAHPRVLRFTLRFIALVQFVLGVGFLLAPEGMASLLGLAATPGWANWMFGMMAARFLAFGYGMLVAARDPAAHRPWLGAMIVIQLIGLGRDGQVPAGRRRDLGPGEHRIVPAARVRAAVGVVVAAGDAQRCWRLSFRQAALRRFVQPLSHSETRG